MFIPDLTDMTLPDGECRAELWVGWLGAEVEHPGLTGEVLRGALRRARRLNQIPDRVMGSHVCKICGGVTGRGQFFIQGINCRYVLPNLVNHYVEAHQYRLPEEVEEALRSSLKAWRLASAPRSAPANPALGATSSATTRSAASHPKDPEGSMPLENSPLRHSIGLSGVLRWLVVVVAVITIGGAFMSGRSDLGLVGLLFIVVAAVLGYRAWRIRR